MSVILLISITLRLFAVVASLVLSRRLRDWRFLLLTGTLLLSLIRQLLTLTMDMPQPWWPFRFDTELDEIPGLLASVMLLLGVHWMGGMFIALRRSEQALRAQETQLRVVMEQVPAVLWTTDTDLKFTLSTGAGLKGLGLSPNQVVGTSIYDYFGTDDPEFPPIRSIHRALQGESSDYEVEWSGRWFQSYTEQLHDEALEPAGTIGVALDITNRKVAEQALSESEQRFKTMFQDAPDAVMLVSADGDDRGKILTANQSAERMHGFGEGELEGMSLQQLNSLEDPSRAPERLKRLAAGEKLTFELAHRRRDGSEFPVEVRASRIMVDGRPCVLAFERDITERRQAEQALRESESRFRSVFYQQFQFMAILDRQGVVLEVNELPLRDQGVARERYVGRFFWETPAWSKLPEWQSRIRMQVESVIATKEMVLSEDMYETEEGDTRFAESAYSAILDSQQELQFVLVQANDVTERKRAEAALHDSQEKLRELNASLEQRVAERTKELQETNAELDSFAHTVSHDLRAPLRAMEGFATALGEDYGADLDQDGRDYIDHIVASAKRMDVLIRDLLSYSRLGRADLRIQNVPLDQVVEESLDRMQIDIEERGATVDVQTDLPIVRGHKSTLVQIVSNLVSNGIKFVGKDTRPQIRIWSESREDGAIRVWIEDNGLGISPDYHDRVFRVFERLHGIEAYPGTGIGLAIVARACERLGGRFGLESEVDKGSRFWIEFPPGESDA